MTQVINLKRFKLKPLILNKTCKMQNFHCDFIVFLYQGETNESNQDAMSTSSDLLDLLLQEDSRSGTGSAASGSGSSGTRSSGSGSGSNGCSSSGTGCTSKLSLLSLTKTKKLFITICNLAVIRLQAAVRAATPANTSEASTPQRTITLANSQQGAATAVGEEMVERSSLSSVFCKTPFGCSWPTQTTRSWWPTSCLSGRTMCLKQPCNHATNLVDSPKYVVSCINWYGFWFVITKKAYTTRIRRNHDQDL